MPAGWRRDPARPERAARRGGVIGSVLGCAGFCAWAFAGAAAHAQGDAPERGYSEAVFVEAAVGFVPYANDVPLLLGAGVRIKRIHELWARAGYIPVGDDIGYGFGCGGYRAALRPGRRVRPVVGGLVAGLRATCSHDSAGRPQCEKTPLFIFAATAGVRIEPVPWLGLQAGLSVGVDSYPNPFGMLELGVSFALPQAQAAGTGRPAAR